MWQCRIAPSLGGGFVGTPNDVWGTVDYKNQDNPAVFFGLYGIKDFMVLHAHKGRRAILWAGSDIRHFIAGYWLDEKGDTRVSPRPFAKWIIDNCESYVENIIEYEALKKLGIESKIVPSFLGNIDDYDLIYKWNEKPKVYTSVSGDNFKLYGWYYLPRLAVSNPDVEFHLYGNTKEFPCEKNMFLHGRVPQEQMNKEIKEMQGALRLTEFDGFSEILAKSILWGQHPISIIPYTYMLSIQDLETLKNMYEPNVWGREYYRKNLNQYPWNIK